MIICFGEALVHFKEFETGHYLKTFSSDVVDSAMIIARDGLDVSVVSALGDDKFGHDIHDMWQNKGLDTSGVYFDKRRPTGTSFSDHQKRYQNIKHCRRHSAISHYSLPSLPHDLIARAKHFYTSANMIGLSDKTRTAVTEALAIAKINNAQTSLILDIDVNSWASHDVKRTLNDYIGAFDYVTCTLETARTLTGSSSEQDLTQYFLHSGVTHWAIINGNGSLLVSANNRAVNINGMNIKNVDLTVCHNYFHGHLLAEIAKGKDFVSAAKFANLASVMCVTPETNLDDEPSCSPVFIEKVMH